MLTTNVDEALECGIPEAILIQRTDVERVAGLMHSDSAFVCKLHGSVSAVKSLVFATEDYEALTGDQAYLARLREVFSSANVVFLGYSVRDEYVLRVLLESKQERDLFGAGSHFVVCSEGTVLPSAHLRPIRYAAGAAADHRSGLQVLDAIVAAQASTVDPFETTISQSAEAASSSIYYLADLMPPGTWQTSQTAVIQGPDGNQHEMVVGPGYVQGEVELTGYSAMHDMVVGLLCFDQIAFNIDSLHKVHTLLGAEAFWRLVDEDVFRVVHCPESPVLIYATPGAVGGGSLANVTAGSRQSRVDQYSPMGAGERIRTCLSAVPGKEQAAERLFHQLEHRVVEVPLVRVPESVRGALNHPSLRRLLGMSGGTSSSSIPRWMAYPVLRLAGVVSTSEVCEHLGASATRLLWGSERLAGAAFCASSSHEWADDAASYVLTGSFDMDVGAIVSQQPELLTRVLEFRSCAAGETFRRDVASQLATNSGGELVASINLGLRNSIPTSALQRARDQMSGLFLPSTQRPRMTSAVWGDLRNGDQRIAGWRRRGKRLLDETCSQLKIGAYDMCPCGSGEKLKFCCYEALLG